MNAQNVKKNVSKSTSVVSKSATVSSNNIKPKFRLTQNYLLIWVDSNINPTRKDCQDTLIQLRSIVNEVQLCTSSDQCIRFLKDINDEKVFVIISGALGKHLVPVIHGMTKVNTIYIFCANKTLHEQWTKDWSKVGGVFTSIKSICESLKKTARVCDQDSVTISFAPKSIISAATELDKQQRDQLEPSFMYSLLFKEIILDMNEDEAKSVKELVACCRNQGIPEVQLKYFQEQFHKKSPVWWYTEEIFLYGMLNKALRTLDMENMTKMGFFIRSLHQQLTQLHREQANTNKNEFTVYRGQGLSKKDFERLCDTVDGLLAFNNFLSTSKDKNVALNFVLLALAKEKDNIGVIFLMKIDPTKMLSSTPFAQIDNYSAVSSEQEILFTTHTVFRIGKIKQSVNNSRLWEVELSITDENDPQLTNLTYRMKEEIQGSTGWYRLGKLMLKVGHFTQAEELYNELLKTVKNDRDKAHIFSELGRVKGQQGDHEQEITYYEKSLEIYRKLLPANHPNLSALYNNIALAYNKMGLHQKALGFYEKIIEIDKNTSPTNHLDLAKSYSNIGQVYKNLNDYSKALDYYEKARQIYDKNLPSNHPDLAITYNKIGSLYTNIDDHAKALTYYEKAEKIYEKTLPVNHPDFATLYNNIGLVYDSMNNYKKALEFLEKALSTYRKSFPETHSYIKEVLDDIESVKKSQ